VVKKSGGRAFGASAAVISKQISHFYIVGLLGSGGMGDVFEAQDLQLPRSVAVKVLKPSLLNSAVALKRFQREAWLAASLNHPNICTILEVGECEGVSFIAMELLHGESLKQRLRAGPVSIAELLAIATDVGHALVAAHGASIVHRDLTPGNIFLTERGAKLLDFGLAKLVSLVEGEPSADTVTDTGTVPGTIHHLAPEQLVHGAIDRRTDLFALGTVLYQALSGMRAFDGRTTGDVMKQILTAQPVPLRRLAPDCPPAIDGIISRLLEKDPDRRYQRAADFLKDVDAARQIDSPVRAGPSSRYTRALGIAVLPFKIVGDEDGSLRSFRDGLAEDVAWWLQQAPGVRVVPRTSTETLRDRSMRAIGEQLGATAVVEGSVQHAAARYRVIANVVHAAQETPMRPALRVDVAADDLLAAQDDASRQIVAAVRAAAASWGVAGLSNNADARAEYQRGLQHARDLFRGGWEQVIEHASRARELDPGMAAAEILLSDTYSFLGMLSLMTPRIAFDKAEQAARRALALAPEAAMAHAALALARFGGAWDWEAAEAGFRRALELDPDLATARVYYSWLLAIVGRDATAFAEADRAVASSRSRFVHAAAVLTYIMGHRYDEALGRIEACVAADPAYLFAILVRGQCHHIMGSYAAAHRDLRQAADLGQRAPHYLGLLGKSYGDAGRHDDARAILAELDQLATRRYVAPHCYVYLLYGIGERTKAQEYQEQAYRDGAPPINYFTPFIRHLFSLDPRHRDRLRQMRLNV